MPTLIDTRCCCSSARYQFISSRAFLRHSGKYCVSSPCPFASYRATTGPHCPPSPGKPVRAKRSLRNGYGVYSKLYVLHTRYRIFLYEAHNLRFFLRPRQLKLDSFNLIYLTPIAKSPKGQRSAFVRCTSIMAGVKIPKFVKRLLKRLTT